MGKFLGSFTSGWREWKKDEEDKEEASFRIFNTQMETSPTQMETSPRGWNQIDTYQKKLSWNILNHKKITKVQRFYTPSLFASFPSSGVAVAVPKMSTGACTLCHRGTLEEFTAQVDGKEYVRCKNKLCAFFCSVNDFEEYDDIVINDVADFYKGLDAPKCYHDQPSILKIKNELYMQEKTAGNPISFAPNRNDALTSPGAIQKPNPYYQMKRSTPLYGFEPWMKNACSSGT
ncbi:hypothetical protein OS493_017603 [Desmophyllum pertusum]|uniref:Uncharacterized protein n=1 Tax=Desmophyllum pertusum TaxID=174260 RepID=A0A9W9ZNZ6_9CNID|nr:hypothetical protein OS493_017603 [Desmophyllum pertusum]